MWYGKFGQPQYRTQKQAVRRTGNDPVRKVCEAMKARQQSRLIAGTDQLPVVPQSAALCYRFQHGRPEVLLITTRRAKRWSVPKGWLIDGLSASETAMQEAWEEAGVVGNCAPTRVGRFSVVKTCSVRGRVLCSVDVFPLHVTAVHGQFPEKGERKRKWCAIEKAARKVASPELAEVLRRFAPRVH